MAEYERYFADQSGIQYNTLKFHGVPYAYRPSEVQYRNKVINSSSNAVVKVYVHIPTGTMMAVKVLNLPIHKDPNFEKNFARQINEVQLHSTLEHANNVIDFYGFFVQQNSIYICLELMDESLANIYKRVHQCYGFFPEKFLGGIAVAVINGLDHCKKKGIMHRDLKPANILIKWSGEIKIADFGVSRVLMDSIASTTVGTCPYWPPERFDSNNLTYDVKADIWSLGITLLETVCGVIPYTEFYGRKFDAATQGYITIQNYIKELSDEKKKEQMISQCFGKHKFYSASAEEFIRLLLEILSKRPKSYGTLKEKSFYRNYMNVSLAKEFINICSFYCALCEVNCSGRIPWNNHVDSISHQNKLLNIKNSDFRNQVVARNMSPTVNSNPPFPRAERIANNDIDNNNSRSSCLIQ